jgi:glycosyltransferase involved in cell wall biosynthesis
MLAAGAGGMYCGSCLRDNRLAATLRAQGRDVILIPLYTPLTLDEPDASDGRVLFGGINVYLRHRYRFTRYLPRTIRRLLDAPGLLRTAGRFAARVTPQETADLALSVLRGIDGPQAQEIEQVAASLEALQPDVVILPDLLFIAFAAPMRKRLTARIVCSLTGEDVFIDDLPQDHRTAAMQHIRDHAPHVDLYLATSTYYAAHAVQHFGLHADRVRVTPIGIDVNAFAPGEVSENGALAAQPARRPFTIGYLARICKEKGLSLLCDAFFRLRREGRNCRLAIAGSIGPGAAAYTQACREKLEDAGLDPYVTWTLSPSQAEKAAFLRGLDVLSVPTAYPEAKGLYVLEALAAGVPVVQPAHGSFPELIEATGGGLMFPPHDHEDLAQNLALLMDTPDLRLKLGRQGRAAVLARFTDHHMATATWEALTTPATAPLQPTL